MDHNYRKMSKSLGNVILPEDIINGKDGKHPLGIDVLRYVGLKRYRVSVQSR